MQKYFLIASFLFLGLGFSWPRFFSKIKNRHSEVNLISSKGTSEFLARGKKSFLVPKSSQKMSLNESLATGSDGEILLRFKSGAEIRILPNSFVTILRKIDTPVISVRRGELEIIEEGQPNGVLIAQGGKETAIENYHTKEQDHSLWVDPLSQDTVKLPETEKFALRRNIEGTATGSTLSSESMESPLRFTETPTEALTEERIKGFEHQIKSMINTTVNKQKNQMYHCYTRLLQKKPDTEGLIELNFKVNPYGKPENLMIIKNEIKDKTFEKCLFQVINRVKFRAFQGEPVSAFLPLRFEKNIIRE